MSKRVAIVGSSGGNLYNLGGKNPFALLGEIQKQLSATEIELGEAVFVAAATSLDQARPDTKARLIIFENDEFKTIYEGTLAEANRKAKERDGAVAEKIEAGEIHGLILVSADPKGTNLSSVTAGAKKGLPAAGTGGTSTSNARSMGLNVVAASGTTGSTNRTRAISYVAGLANFWKIKYKPIIGSYEQGAEGSPLQRINFRGIMGTALPAFIAMAIAIALSRLGVESFKPVFDALIGVLPVVVSAIAAKQISGYDEVGIVAGIIAGALAAGGGILGGLIAGIVVGVIVPYLVAFSAKKNIPATTLNILAGGLSGLAVGLVMHFGFSPIALAMGDGIRRLIEMALEYNSVLAGAIGGLLIWPALMAGVYHSAILPIILLETEKYGNSFLGAIDSIGLGGVALGLTLANFLFPRRKADRVAVAPSLFVVIVFGTFVEAAYPFMFSDRIVFFGAFLAALLGGTVVGMFQVRGIGYVPLVLKPLMSNKPVAWVGALLVSAGVSFIIAVVANRIWKRKNFEQEVEVQLK